MTRVVFLEGPEGPEGFICQGHAGYGEAGADIVCAAVSILTATCANAMESVAGIVPRLVAREEEAYLKLTLPAGLDQARIHDAQVLLKAMRQGFEDLREAYPKYIHLSNQEWRKS